MTDLTTIERKDSEGDGSQLKAYQVAAERILFINGLHDLADFLHNHPDLPLPYGDLSCWDHGAESIESASKIARALGTFEKKEGVSYLYLNKEFGPIQLQYAFPRSAVCERVVVGTREVEREVTPTHDRVFEMVEEEIVEWKCPSLLEPSS